MKVACSIPGCGKPSIARGWCNPHWKRWRRNGHPLAGRPSGKYRAEIPCLIEGCERSATKLGLCNRHYLRQYKHGDPSQVAYPWGEAQAYFRDVVLPYDGDGCLIWPFSRYDSGYGCFLYRGRMQITSRAVCVEVHGEPPTPAHEAAHSCGKGHEGCVSPSHLSWKTHTENQADRVLHGTTNRGERCAAAKLSEADVLRIRDEVAGGARGTCLARKYGVSKATIYDIMARRTWFHLDEMETAA